MTETERDVLHEFYGPYDTTCFAIFTIEGNSYRLSFDEGPAYNFDNILAPSSTVFKFPPHSLFELRVSVLYGKEFKFSGTQIPTFAPRVKAATKVQSGAPTPSCCSIYCEDSIPCPDPLKPVMVCDGGIARCVASTVD